MHRLIVSLATFLSISSLCFASSVVEVLYLAQPQGNGASLSTYKVNPKTAAAEPIGTSLNIPASSLVPLTIGGTHLLYVWNSTDVWMYKTNPSGVPRKQPSQHLSFGFAHPVQSFLVDPDGKFAYAAVTWYDPQNYSFNTQMMLFTIDSATGKLTNTGQSAANYGPSEYFPLNAIFFLGSRARLYVEQADDGPHSCGAAYYYYPVNQKTGMLGTLNYLVGWGDCGVMEVGAVSDRLTVVSDARFGPGSGSVVINNLTSGQQILCGPSMAAFCGDETNGLTFDPVSRNLFFWDYDTNQVNLGHINWPSDQLVATSAFILGQPMLFFSPDSKLVYAIGENDVEIYAFASASGTFRASTSFTRTSGAFSVATATLRN